MRRAHGLIWGMAPVVGAALTVIAFFSPMLAAAGSLVLVFAYVPPLRRLVALGKQGHGAASTQDG